MPCAPISRLLKAEAGELMSGVLEVVRGSALASRSAGLSPGAQRLFVRVYRTSSEHFAVLFPVRAIVAGCRPLASLNLRSCCVKTLSGREFRVSARACEGLSLTFRALEGSSEAHMADWMRAFGAPEGLLRRKRLSPLPVLQEDEEGELQTRG